MMKINWKLTINLASVVVCAVWLCYEYRQQRQLNKEMDRRREFEKTLDQSN